MTDQALADALRAALAELELIEELRRRCRDRIAALVAETHATRPQAAPPKPTQLILGDGPV